MSIAPYAKALVGAAVAGLASLQQALDGDNTVTGSEWISIAGATLAALLAVFYIPNRTPAPKPDEGGAADVALIFYVLGTVFFLVATLNLLGVGTRGLFG